VTVAPGQQPLETIGPVLSDLDTAEQERTFEHLATRQICPFLAIDGGGWRSSSASRDHRCGAVTPPVPLAIDKQRRLCLTDTHLECATFMAATGASASGEMAYVRAALGRPGAGATPTVTRWSLVRTVPVVLDRGRVPSSVGAIARDRRAGQLVLAGLLIAAFAAVAVARLGSGASDSLGATGSSAPSASAAATASPAPTAVPSAAGTAAPSVAPTVAPTAAVTAAPSAAARQTYTVKSGDTLGAIANRFGTTVDAIAKLNGIARADYGRIQVGRVLQIP
jgi:LysM repeat protein